MKVLLAAGPLLLALFKFKWIAMLIPGIGPVLGVALSAIGAALKYLCKGAFQILVNPASLAVAIVLVMVAVLFGIRVGIKFDAHLVAEANSLLATKSEQLNVAESLNRQWMERHHEEEKRAKAAAEAAAEAESAHRAAMAKRLRDKQREGNAVPAKKPEGSGVFNLGTIQWPGGK